MKFEDYQERFKDLFMMKRQNGIIEVRAHTEDGPATWSWDMHEGLSQMFKAVGADPENEVFIFTGTGDKFLAQLDPQFITRVAESMKDPAALRTIAYETYASTTTVLSSLLWDVHIPTIGVINGPGIGHTELHLACDLTLCADDVTFHDFHFPGGVVPGDGEYGMFQKLMGDKRANYLAYFGETVDAKTALDWGLVNEVLTRDKLLPRAWELAETLMKKDRFVRRLTHDLMRQSMRRHIMTDGQPHTTTEMFGSCLSWLGATMDLNEINATSEQAERNEKQRRAKSKR
jgi:enoyl-CoA hydratase/carnithine racemase